MLSSTAPPSRQVIAVVVNALTFPKMFIVTEQLFAHVIIGPVMALPLPETFKITVQLLLPIIAPPTKTLNAPVSTTLIYEVPPVVAVPK